MAGGACRIPHDIRSLATDSCRFGGRAGTRTLCRRADSLHPNPNRRALLLGGARLVPRRAHCDVDWKSPHANEEGRAAVIRCCIPRLYPPRSVGGETAWRQRDVRNRRGRRRLRALHDCGPGAVLTLASATKLTQLLGS